MAELTQMAAPESNKSVRQVVYDGILNYIKEQNIKPGDKLPNEHELVEMLNVSRTSLREGIRMLEGAGFITTKQGGGMYVAEYDGSALLDYIQYSIGYGNGGIADLYDMRKCLEIHYISEAAEKVTEDQIRRLKETVRKMDDNRLLEYHWHDMDFHLILYENITNQLAAHIIRLYWDVMLVRYMPTLLDNLPGTVAGNHEMIIRAMESRNPQFARAAMKVHMFDSHIV